MSRRHPAPLPSWSRRVASHALASSDQARAHSFFRRFRDETLATLSSEDLEVAKQARVARLLEPPHSLRAEFLERWGEVTFVRSSRLVPMHVVWRLRDTRVCDSGPPFPQVACGSLCWTRQERLAAEVHALSLTDVQELCVCSKCIDAQSLPI